MTLYHTDKRNMNYRRDFDRHRGGWRMGTVTAGKLVRQSRYDEWKIEEPSTLVARFTHEALDLPQVGYIGSFVGRTAMLYRAKEFGCYSCIFIDLPNHYVACSTDTNLCCDAISRRNCPLDSSKPVLCPYGGGQLATLRIRPRRQRWVGALYRLHADVDDVPGWETFSPAEEERRKNEIRGRQETLGRFLTDPFESDWGDPEFLILKGGRLVAYQPGACGVDGLSAILAPRGIESRGRAI
jgi:hypothetical protein